MSTRKRISSLLRRNAKLRETVAAEEFLHTKITVRQYLILRDIAAKHQLIDGKWDPMKAEFVNIPDELWIRAMKDDLDDVAKLKGRSLREALVVFASVIVQQIELLDERHPDKYGWRLEESLNPIKVHLQHIDRVRSSQLERP